MVFFLGGVQDFRVVGSSFRVSKLQVLAFRLWGSGGFRLLRGGVGVQCLGPRVIWGPY